MTVVYSAEASRDLDEVFAYNQRRYDVGHAVDYVLFLENRIDGLIGEPEAGPPIEGIPDCRALTIRRKPRGHGHIAIYRVEDDVIRVLHIFHTAQDVAGRLLNE